MAQCTPTRSNAPAEGLLARARLTVDGSAAARTARPEFFARRWKRSMPRAERRCGYDGCVRSGAEAPRVSPLRRSVPQPPRSLPSAYERWTRTRVQEAQVVEHLVPIATCHLAPRRHARRTRARRRPARRHRARRQSAPAPPRPSATRAQPPRSPTTAGAASLLALLDEPEDPSSRHGSRSACARRARAYARRMHLGGMATSANVCKTPVLAS